MQAGDFFSLAALLLKFLIFNPFLWWITDESIYYDVRKNKSNDYHS